LKFAGLPVYPLDCEPFIECRYNDVRERRIEQDVEVIRDPGTEKTQLRALGSSGEGEVCRKQSDQFTLRPKGQHG
jgi:hypothetical protein